MIWEPFALAALFGVAVSLTLYFIFVWPRREPAAAQEQDGSPEETRDP